jgi:hypothetical protein
MVVTPLRTLLAPLLPTLGALLGAVDDDVARCLLATAWGCLPTSLCRMKFSRLIAGGILGGDVELLLGGVPENSTVCALARVPHMVFRSHVRAP